MASIFQIWVQNLGLRHQGALLTAIRGCDVVERDDESKWLARFYRACILRPHCGDVRQAASFMLWPDDTVEVAKHMNAFIRSHDHYPHHYLMHLIHAAEIVGYKHPDRNIRDYWLSFYRHMCNKFHMNPESEGQLDERLNADEETFGKQQ